MQSFICYGFFNLVGHETGCFRCSVSAVVNFFLILRDRKVHKEGKLSYADFVWFLISEEDKKTDTR